MNFGDIFRLFVRIKRWFGTKTSVFFLLRGTQIIMNFSLNF